MIRAGSKIQIIEKLNMLLRQFHQQISDDGDNVLEALFACQKLAIEVGNELETFSDDCASEVHLLEEYCEVVYQCSVEQKNLKAERKKLDALIERVKSLVEKKDTFYLAIFMPYKASMWDSLESIWKAVRADKKFRCVVMPIPYYEYNSEKKELVYCYEGDKLPEGIPIIDFHEIDLEREHPDVIYIHNPYDDANFVTSVPEKYFSRELKKYTDKLVYVPYYVKYGAISETHRRLPVCYHMDYMIAQSEQFASGLKGYPYEKKAIVLGSPKFDRIIQRRTEAVRNQLPGSCGAKKKILLNTSLNNFLLDISAVLHKLRSLFEVVAERKDVELVWRPHPLLEATIHSLRPQEKEKYTELKKYFLEQKIGMIDTSVDVTDCILQTDAYMGESASSLVDLCAVAEKPIFVLNNYIYKEESAEEKRRIYIQDMEKVGDRWWIITDMNRLFEKEEHASGLHCAGEIKGQPRWNMANRGLCTDGKNLYFAPDNAIYPAYYDIENKHFGQLGDREIDAGFHCGAVCCYKEKIFYLPHRGKNIYEYNRAENTWKTYSEAIAQLHAGAKRKRYEGVYSMRREGHFLWMTATDVNHILRFDMDTGESKLYQIGEEENGYSGIEVDGESIWLAEVGTGNLLRWDREKETYTVFCMPKQFVTWKSSAGRMLAHKQMHSAGDWIVTTPGFSNVAVKLHKRTGQTQVLGQKFWDEMRKEDEQQYCENAFETCAFSKKIADNKILIQRRMDAAILIIDVETEEFQISYLKIEEKMLNEILEREDGFERINRSLEFSCRENRYFSVNTFLDRVVEDKLDDILERQRNFNRELSVNLDGTCGEKVHAFVKKKLEESEG